MDSAYKVCLLVDDNYIDNFISRMVLENARFAEEIVAKQLPLEAIEALKTGTLKPDVIFLDIRMPLMDGFEFLQEYDKLPAEAKKAKVYMLSSSLDPADHRLSAQSQYIKQFVSKPLTPQSLKEIKA